MQDKINELKKHVGTPYQMKFEDGNYCGCFYPVYAMWPDAPKYPLPTDDNAVNYVYGITRIMRECEKIDIKNIQMGDIITCQYNNELHVGVMISKTEVIHVFKDYKLQIDKLSARFFKDKNLRVFRKKNEA